MLIEIELLDGNLGELFHTQICDLKDGWAASAATACFYEEDN